MANSKKQRKSRAKPVAERIAAKIGAPTKTGCREWTGDTTKNGYAAISVKNETTGKWTNKRAQRLQMEQHLGRALKPHEHVMHTCNHKACMNIDHHRVGSRYENTADAKRDNLLTGPKLSDREAIKVANLLDRHVSRGKTIDSTVRFIARDLSLSQNAVYDIWRGNWHDDVTGMSARRAEIKEQGRLARAKAKASNQRVRQSPRESVSVASSAFTATPY